MWISVKDNSCNIKINPLKGNGQNVDIDPVKLYQHPKSHQWVNCTSGCKAENANLKWAEAKFRPASLLEEAELDLQKSHQVAVGPIKMT